MSKIPPRNELVNTFEFEEVAKSKLRPAVYSTIAGSDRAAFDRMTFRPRMLVPTTDLDLSVELFGAKHVTPILVGPVTDQRQYHPDGELATARGASAAKAGVIISSRSSVPIDQIAEATKTPRWYSTYATDANALQQAQRAVAAGFQVVCVTIGASFNGSQPSANPRTDWKAIDRIRQGLTVPLIIKGVMTTDDAKTAMQAGAQGIVVSNHGGLAAGATAPIAVLASVVDAIEGKAPVLVDGSFRRGTDVLMALVLGAKGVLLSRPIMWGLASYGAEGVQSVLELVQNDLGRNMAMLGAANLAGLNRSMVKVHRLK